MIRKFARKLVDALPFKKELFGLLRLASPPETVFRHLYFKGPFEVRLGNTRFTMIHHGFQLENNVFWKGLAGWEPTSLRMWITLCREAGCILDVGANTGLFSLVAKTVNPSADVHSFEPVPRVFDRLKANIKVNQYDITPHRVGISNFTGKATIFDLPTDHVYSVTINKNLNLPGASVIPTEITVTTLDDFAAVHNLRKIDLIKLDVETHEPEVLEGARQTLRENHPAVLIEILNEEVAERVTELVKGIPYVYLLMDEESGPRLVEELRPHRHTNFLLCPKSSANELLQKYEKTKTY